MIKATIDVVEAISGRMKPSFIIIGGVKCASTSLFRYLIDHPNIIPGSYKEPGFFNGRGLFKSVLTMPNYLKMFPKKHTKNSVKLNWAELTTDGKVVDTKIEKKRLLGQNAITGEATATYNCLAEPSVVKRVLPHVKIIFIVRNPTDRFISHYNMFKRFHSEDRKGYEIDSLVPFVEHEIAAFQAGNKTRIIEQGLYHNLIMRWHKSFDSKHFYLIEFDKLNASDEAKLILNEITEFLDLPHHDYSSITANKYNVAPMKQTDKKAIELLNNFYAESNELLEKDFGINFK